MSNNKQSSVEFFLYEMFSLLGEFENKALPSYKIMDLFEQAKAMHEEEMKNFTEDWYHNGPLLGVDVLVSTSIEKHYNETFGGKNEQ